MSIATTPATLLRFEVEDFLFAEAALLDAWRLTEWLQLFDEDARYLVPPTDRPHARDTVHTAFIIADDRQRLAGRVARLETDESFVERPRSRTRRLIGNVRVEQVDDDVVVARSNFIVHRTRRAVVDCFTGCYEHRLRRAADSWLIGERWAILDAEALQPHGKIGFLL